MPRLKPIYELEFCRKCAERSGLDCRIVEARKCIYCNGVLWKLDKLGRRILDDLKDYEFESFLVGTRLEGSLKALEEYLTEEYGIEVERSIKYQLNRELGFELQKAGKIPGFNKPDVTILFNPETLELEYKIRSVYIFGRYIKRVRDISQTRWFCSKCMGKGCEECNFQGRKYYTSVEELIAEPCIEVFGGENAFLHGAGREDVDARMLGSGRPFVLEIVKPRRRKANLKEVESLINDKASPKVVVKDLAFVDDVMVRFIKGTPFRKKYRAKVRFGASVEEKRLKRAVEELSNRIIEQRTPLRVQHRRADLIRKKKVYGIKILLHKGNVAVMEIESDSGLYIKELVSGDEGRTRPSLSELLEVNAWVEKLDVIEVLE